jgi:hypothetical protein
VPSPTFENRVTSEEISLALEHVLIAPVGTSYDRSRIDVSSPPAGFIHLGAVRDDAPNLVIQKAKYVLATGLPRTTAYEAVVALSGEFSTVLHAHSNVKAHFGMGGPRPLNQFVTATSACVVTADTLTRRVVSVNTTTGFAVGMMVVTDANSLVPTTYNTAYVNSIGGGQLYLSTEGFPFVPVAGQPLRAVERSELAFGTRLLPYFTILGVADFLNNGQVVHMFERASPRGQWQERLMGTEHVQIQAMWDLNAYSSDRYTAGSNELLIGERLVFNSNTLQ